ncbi:espin-like [Actinia tenebrosa]|uniref:Espin-like n=1 Tax=Actinia tenebrosa TaxID=6105 RepID=A0A6P8HHJ9_ACTTE|nr:espin-like [Actinia tenebrosa]
MAEEAERVLAAARDGDISTLQSLKRSVPFAFDSFGATALHHATRYGKLDCLRWMVEKTGMKAKLKAKNGATPLHDACTQGKLLCVKFFIQECNLSPDVTDNSGHAPLHLAARFGYLDIVKWLVEKAKCNPRLKTLNKMSPVHFAAIGGHLKCLEFLISKLNPVAVNERATDGTTPAYLAAQNGHFSCLKYLHTVGARCETKSRDGMHLIHAAAQNGHLDCLGYLVVQGLAKEIEPDITGATPAHYAAGEGHVTVLKWLHKRSNLNVKDSLGGTPLHDASEKGQYKAIQFLVEVALLDTKLKDNSGMSPIDLADKYGHKQCYEYMKDAASKILKIRAAKMSNYSKDFDKQIVEKDTGSSFLHVLKKKPKPAERPPSPKSAVGPDVPPLECSPEVSPSSSPVPPLLLYGKTNEWNDVIIDQVEEKESKEKSEVVVTYEKEDKNLRSHLMDNGNMSRYSPLPPVFSLTQKTNEDEFVSSDVDAYSKNKENALEFDALSQEQLTEEVLNAAKMCTRMLNTKLQNGCNCPTPVHDFDHRSGEIAARHVEEFASKIQASRSRGKSPVTVSKTQQDTVNENIKNENKNMDENESESPVDEITDPVEENSVALDQDSVTSMTSSPSPANTVPLRCDSLRSESPDGPPRSPESLETPVKKEKSFESSSDEQSLDQSMSPNPDTWPSPSPHSSETDRESVLDEENYDTTTDDEKSKSLPREKSEVKKDFVPLRKQQLIPLPHFGEASNSALEPESLPDDETWRSLPEWKRQVLKNRIMKEQSAELEKRKKEEEVSNKWEGVPAWKIPIMQRRELDRIREDEKNSSMPAWRKQLAQKKQEKVNKQD